MKLFLIYFFAFLVSVFIFLSSGIIDSQDGFQYVAVARNIYYTGKPTAPVYEYDKEKNIHMSTYIGKDGNTYSPTGLGYSLVFLPAVALTDLAYKFYGVSPPSHFPLESDWLLLLLVSFVNSFFIAGLGVVLFFFFTDLNLSKKEALVMSLVTIFCTNLSAYGKHVLTHIMFAFVLFYSFYMLKKYAISKKTSFLIFSGILFGICAITYNQTFILSIPSYILYYFLLLKPKFNSKSFKKVAKDSLFFFAGALPFVFIYFWFENLKAHADLNINSAAFFSSYAGFLLKVPAGVLFEGIYGQLFSVGRSVFLYSPLLLIIIFFWHKIDKKIKPEFIAFLTLSVIYIYFYASQYSLGRPDQGYAGFWHGESSWGPRYLTPLIPFGMLIVGYIYKKLSKKFKYFVFLPLSLAGLYVGILGVFLPYQIKYTQIEHYFINGTEYTHFVWSNFLPRESPLLSMSKKLIKHIQLFPLTFDHGIYNVKLYDGFDFPFNVGPERWRTINTEGYLSFDNLKKDEIKKISFGMINHPITQSSASASLNFYLNNKNLNQEPIILKLTERKLIEFNLDKTLIKDKNNQLLIKVVYDNPKIISGKHQILGLISFLINGKEINKESLDAPYIYSFGPKLTGMNYQNYGGNNKDPWLPWNIHSQIFENTFDFWWIKNLYYWDVPKKFIISLFILNISAIIFFGLKLAKLIKNEK